MHVIEIMKHADSGTITALKLSTLFQGSIKHVKHILNINEFWVRQSSDCSSYTLWVTLADLLPQLRSSIDHSFFISTTLLVDSESVCSILNQSISLRVIKSSSNAFRLRENVKPRTRNFSNELIQIKGKIQTTVSSKGVTTRSCIFTDVADGLKLQIGCEWFDQLGLVVTYSPSQTSNQVKRYSPHSAFKERIALKFTNLISRIERSKNLVSKPKYHKVFQRRHQKGRRIRISLPDKAQKRTQKTSGQKTHNKTRY